MLITHVRAAWQAWTDRLAALAGWRAARAAFLLGLLAAVALPPFNIVPVLLAAIPGLLVLIGTAHGPAAAARRGWWFGFGLSLLGLYWITDAILIEAATFWWLVPLAVPALAALLALFVAAAAAAARLARPGWRRVIVLAGAWTLADLARQFVLTGFPWNPLGSAWAIRGAAGDLFIQPAALVGVHGLTLATLLLAAVPLVGPRWRAALGAGFALWIGYGAWRLAAPPPQAPGVQVVLVQGNVAQGQRWTQTLALQIFRQYLALTGQATAALPADARAVVVWPETASPFLLGADVPARQMVAQAARGALVLAGAVRFGPDQQPRNSLFAVTPDARVAAQYDKWHLVPFGEYEPSWLPLAFAVAPGHGFAPGTGPATLTLPGLPSVGPLICYEAIFPGQVVDTAARPGWLVNLTNDAWFGDSTGPRQHLAAARLRAVEEGLPLMRAANTGISAGFDSRGRELGRLGLDQAGTLTLALPGADPATPFGRFGLIIPLFLGLAAMSLGLGVPRRSVRR